MKRLPFILIGSATLAIAYSGFAAAARPYAAAQPRFPSDTVVILAAGDIATCGVGAWATAQLLDGLEGQILVLGDAAYASRRDPDPYRTCYDSTWGRHKERTRVTIGNHDAEPRTIRHYFDYFGDAAGQRPGGYYSFDIGAWHVLALNSVIDMGPRSDQGKWMAADLAANSSKCSLAFMHHPRFSSGPHHRQWTTRAFRVLDSAGVDVLLSGHDHIYERFAPMNDDGELDENGVRQFIVGTGGAGLYAIREIAKNSETRTNGHYGVLKLTLRPDSYSWNFITIQGGFADSGTTTCR